MYIKTDILRQNLFVYCAISISGGLGLFCLYISIIHVPLMIIRYENGKFLKLTLYHSTLRAMIIVSLTTLISSVVSCCIFVFFISNRIRMKFDFLLKPANLLNTLLLFTNIWCLLSIIDPIGTMRTEIQHNFQLEMQNYQIDKDTNKEMVYVKVQIDKIQTKIKCCGINGPTDWFNVKWLSFDELKQLNSYKNQFGLVGLAPLSCCDRSKTLICPLKDPFSIKHYYSNGCSEKLFNYFVETIVFSEILLIVLVVILQVLLSFLMKLIKSSISTMKSGKYGVNMGRASLFDHIPTRHLELQCRGTPLLVPPMEIELPDQMNRYKKIEKKMKLGCIINDIPYLRNIRPGYCFTTLQYTLKIYIPILERAIFDEDPNFMVILFRFFMKALTGFSIAMLFLMAFSTKIDKQDSVSTTLTNLIKYTTIVSFTFAFIKSKKFRTIGILLIPNLGMKTGRTFFLAEMAQITAIGPMAKIASNLQMVMMSVHCTMGLAANISQDAQQLALNPMRNLIISAIDSSEGLKRATLDVYNASQPVSADIESSENRSEEIRQSIYQGTDGSQEQLKHRFSNLLTKLDKSEQVKFQRKTDNLRSQYQKLQDQFKRSMVMINQYKDVFDNRSSTISSQMRTKMFSGCASVEKVKSQVCQATIMSTCTLMQKMAFASKGFGIDLTELCMDEMNSESSCNIKKAMEKAQRCANEREAANAKDGFGAMYRGTQTGIQSMQKLHGMNVGWNFSRVKFNVDKDDVLHGTAKLTFKITDGVILFVDIILILFVMLKILVMLVIMRAYSYCKKYLTDIDHDNKYISPYFEYIDLQRKEQNRSSLFPLKSFEMKKVLYKRLLYTSDEIKKTIRDSLKLTTILLPLGILFLISDVFYEALIVVREASETQLHVTGETINVTTDGSGIVKHLLDIMISEIAQLSAFNATYSLSDCSPEITAVSQYYRRVFLILLALVIALTLFGGYFIRVCHVICAYFYPRREKQRIVHLYNTMLLQRKRFMDSRRNILIFRVRRNRLEMQQGLAVGLRYNYPLCCGWLGKFAKQRCLICNDKERKNFVVCSDDLSGFCGDCFEDMDGKCLVCETKKLDYQLQQQQNQSDTKDKDPVQPLMFDEDFENIKGNNNKNNANCYNYAQYELSSSDAESFCSSSDTSSDEYREMIEDSKEVVGWNACPRQILLQEIKKTKKLQSL